MNNRKPYLISFGVSSLGLMILGLVLYSFLAGPYLGKEVASAFTIMVRALYSGFNESTIAINIVDYLVIAAFLGISIPWIIIDVKRHKHIVFLFIPLYLLVSVSLLFFILLLIATISANGDIKTSITPSIFIFLSYIACILLFISDLLTGKKHRYLTSNDIIVNNSDRVYHKLDDNSEDNIEKAEIKETTDDKPVEEEIPTAPVVIEKKEIEVVNERKDEKDFSTEPKEQVKRRGSRTPKKNPTTVKAYHVSRRAELGKWQVKTAGSTRALKLFSTQK